MVFAARQLQEKCREQNKCLFMTFVDLTKAFDTVCREGLWRIMEKFGCPQKLIKIVREFHDGMVARVKDNSESSRPFPVNTGVKQGCVLAPTLFSMMFAAMLTDAFAEDSVGLDLSYRTDGKLFNLRRLQAKTKVKKDCARDMLFADDCALCAGTQEEMQHGVSLFANACNNFGLTISVKKTEVMYQPAPGDSYDEAEIYVDGQLLTPCEKFVYLGSTLSKTAVIDDEVALRISRACATFGRLRNSVWDRRGISMNTKLKVYRAVVIPSLLYSSETWTVYARHAKALNATHLRLLRKLLRVKWQERIPDTEILTRSGMDSIHTMLLRTQLRWAGHVVRMPENRFPKRIMYGELSSGKRSHGGQRKRYKDTLKAALKSCRIDPDSWEKLCLDREKWRAKVRHGTKDFEERRIEDAKRKRQVRKERARSDVDGHIPCPRCPRMFRARIGLISHMKTHA